MEGEEMSHRDSDCCGATLGYSDDEECWCCSFCGLPAGFDMSDEDEDEE
jgi:hypothetical protein